MCCAVPHSLGISSARYSHHASAAQPRQTREESSTGSAALLSDSRAKHHHASMNSFFFQADSSCPVPRPAPELLEVVVKQREGNQHWRAKYIVATKVTRQDKVSADTGRGETACDLPIAADLARSRLRSVLPSSLSSANVRTTRCPLVCAPGSARSTH